MDRRSDMRALLDSLKPTTTETLKEAASGFGSWGKDTISEGWPGEFVSNSGNHWQDKASGMWYWQRSSNGHIIASGECDTEEEAATKANHAMEEEIEAPANPALRNLATIAKQDFGSPYTGISGGHWHTWADFPTREAAEKYAQYVQSIGGEIMFSKRYADRNLVWARG